MIIIPKMIHQKNFIFAYQIFLSRINPKSLVNRQEISQSSNLCSEYILFVNKTWTIADGWQVLLQFVLLIRPASSIYRKWYTDQFMIKSKIWWNHSRLLAFESLPSTPHCSVLPYSSTAFSANADVFVKFPIVALSPVGSSIVAKGVKISTDQFSPPKN